MEDIEAVCHAKTVFYQGIAERFPEAVLSIPEKVRGFARWSATSTQGAATVVGQRSFVLVLRPGRAH
jgi:hypothetical protein